MLVLPGLPLRTSDRRHRSSRLTLSRRPPVPEVLPNVATIADPSIFTSTDCTASITTTSLALAGWSLSVSGEKGPFAPCLDPCLLAHGEIWVQNAPDRPSREPIIIQVTRPSTSRLPSYYLRCTDYLCSTNTDLHSTQYWYNIFLESGVELDRDTTNQGQHQEENKESQTRIRRKSTQDHQQLRQASGSIG